MSERLIEEEVRLGRCFIRRGDAIKVRLRGKTQFRDGFIFKGWDVKEQMAIVRAPQGNERYVGLDGIKRKAQTKNGERLR